MKNVKHPDLYTQHLPIEIRKRLGKGESRHKNVSDAVLGSIDGCVTTFAVVSGVLGGGFSATVALVLGFANLFADGFSMAISNFESKKAHLQFLESIRQTEAEHIEKIPEGEREEIRQIFKQKGFEGDTLEKIIDTISRDKNLWIDTMLVEEHGLQKNAPNPLRGAIVTFLAFVSVGAMPLIPFFFSTISLQNQFIFSASLAALVFFLIGMLKSLVFSKPLLRSGLSTLITGSAAASLAFLTGYLLREIIGVT